MEVRRYPEASSLDSPFGPSVAFAKEKLLIGVAYGDAGGARNDVMFSVNLDTAEMKTVIDAGAAFALGDVLCTPGCTDLCLLADSQSKTVHVYRTGGGTLAEDHSFPVDPSIGLPPRGLGAL
jgi:hypothetical protein